MGLISLNNVSLRYGAHVLLDRANLSVEQGDALAIVGRNGCGKTSLLKIIAGIAEPDDGQVERQRGIKAAYLPQDVPADISGSAYDSWREASGKRAKSLRATAPFFQT